MSAGNVSTCPPKEETERHSEGEVSKVATSHERKEEGFRNDSVVQKEEDQNKKIRSRKVSEGQPECECAPLVPRGRVAFNIHPRLACSHAAATLL